MKITSKTVDVNGENLHIGDGVVCTAKYTYPWLHLKHGTIVYIRDSQIGVKWDEKISSMSNGDFNGHNCDGYCEWGYGWYVLSYELELETTPSIPMSPEELDALLS